MVSVDDETLDSGVEQPVHRVTNHGLPGYREERFGEVLGERAQTGTKPRTEEKGCARSHGWRMGLSRGAHLGHTP
jgi:hypothetical protein